jgi:hypothetical protein
MIATVQAQGFTAEAETLPDGSLRLSLVSASGHRIASATLVPDVPMQLPDDVDAWSTVPAA